MTWARVPRAAGPEGHFPTCPRCLVCAPILPSRRRLLRDAPHPGHHPARADPRRPCALSGAGSGPLRALCWLPRRAARGRPHPARPAELSRGEGTCAGRWRAGRIATRARTYLECAAIQARDALAGRQSACRQRELRDPQRLPARQHRAGTRGCRRITGVLDWEMATIGDPLMDLGGALAYWVRPAIRGGCVGCGASPATLRGCSPAPNWCRPT